MQSQIDWRHYAGAGLLIVLVLAIGWKVLNGPPEMPREPAPAGPNARMQDAPERPPGQPAPAGFPTAR
jgi:hypothetical protein